MMDNRNNRLRKRCLAALLSMGLLVVTLLGGCGREGASTKVILTTGFGRDEVFRINTVSCDRTEIMVYLTNTQNEYENVYGSEIWEKDLGGITLEDNVKETVLARIARIKAMTLLAEQQEVVLDEEEIATANEAAKTYFNSLSDAEVALLGVSLEKISLMYQDYALANKVYNYIIKDINPEISDDEARTITVEHILIRTYTTDLEGNQIADTVQTKEEAAQLAAEVWQLLQDGEDFEALMELYNEDAQNTYSIRHGEADPAFEEAAFALASGEISGVIETAAGYEIIKCISSFDREQTDVNKVKIVQERRDEVFNEQYEEFVGTLTKQLNEELWESITFTHDEQLTTSDFFVVYSDYFSDGILEYELEED